MDYSPRRHRPWWLLALLLLQLVAVAAPLSARAGVAPAAPDPYAALLPGVRDRIARATGDLDRYRIEARLFPDAGDGGTVAGKTAVTFTNRTGDVLDDVWFRLLPNASYAFGATSLDVSEVRMRGRRVDPKVLEFSRANTALRVPLAAPLAPGDAVELTLVFATALSAAGFGTLGQSVDGTWLLNVWHPLVAPYDPDTGWWLDPLTVLDPYTLRDAALYDVTFTAPADLKLVAPGVVISEETTGDLRRRRYVAGPVRDFTIVADADIVSVATTVGGTRLTSHAEPGDSARARSALRSAADALEAFSDRFGAYPYRRLDLFQYSIPGAAGFAVSGMIFTDGSLVGPPDAGDADAFDLGDGDDVDLFPLDEADFRAVVAHEVAHQWWGMSAGADYARHAFIVEGLAEYSANAFVRWEDGDREADRMLIRTARPYLDVRGFGDDWIVDRTEEGTLLGLAQAGIVYAKAAVGYHAIRIAIGDAAFADALAAYNADFAFRVATPADLLAAFEEASGEDLGPLWRFWFESDDVELGDVRAVVAGQ